MPTASAALFAPRRALLRGRRFVLIGTVIAVVWLPLAAVGGYAWYLRSSHYRATCAERLSATLGLPADIAGVTPRSWTSRAFRGVEVWLPQRRDRALYCEEALLELTPTVADPDAYEIRLRAGACEISTRTWLRADYRQVVDSGLKPGFVPGGPRRVLFREMDLIVVRDDIRATLHDALGEIDFASPTLGRAHAVCHQFNQHRSAEPIALSVLFSPSQSGVRIDDLELRLPEIPLSQIGLEQLLPVAPQHGRFDGMLRYQESTAGRVLVLGGRCMDLDLPELTAGWLSPPLRGACPELELHHLRLVNRMATDASFRGRLRDVGLRELGQLMGGPALSGVAALEVGVGKVSEDGVDRLTLSGQCLDVSLEELTRSLGHGLMSGTLRVVIEDLSIRNNHVESFDALIQIDPADSAPLFVERELLLHLARSLLKTDVPAFFANRLPQRLEYTKFGARLSVRDEELTIQGTHGFAERTILTARLFGSEQPLINEPRAPIDLSPLLDQLRARLQQFLSERGQRRSASAPALP